MAQDSEVEDGTQEAPTSEGSKSETGQRGSATEAELRRELMELNKKLDLIARQQQGDKDRAVKKVSGKVDALEGDVRELLRLAQREGKTINDVVADLDSAEERESRELLLEMARSFREGRFLTAGVGNAAQKGVDVSEVLSDLELDAEDLRVKEFRSRQFASQDEAYREGVKLLKTIRTIQPTEADKPSEVGRTHRPAGKQDELMKEYQNGSKGKFGRELLMFKQQMREKGLEIS